MNWTKVREKAAAIVVIIFVILLGVIALAFFFGIRIPIVSDLLGSMGIGV